MTNVAERRPSLDGAPARSEAEGIWPAHLVIGLRAYGEQGKAGAKQLWETLKGTELRPGALPPLGKTYPVTTPRSGETPVGALGNS